MSYNLELVQPRECRDSYYGWIGSLTRKAVDYFGHRKSLNNAGRALIEHRRREVDNKILEYSLHLSARAINAVPAELRQQTLSTQATEQAQLPRLQAIQRRLDEVPSGAEAHLAPLIMQLCDHAITLAGESPAQQKTKVAQQ